MLIYGVCQKHLGIIRKGGQEPITLMGRHFHHLAKMTVHYYERAKVVAEKTGSTSNGYYYQTLYYLGEAALKRGDKQKATYYYKLVKKLAGRKDGSYDKAKQGLKDM